MVAVLLLAVLWGCGLAAPVGAAAPAGDAALVEQARLELGREDYEEALELLNRAWRAGLRSPEAAFLLGRTHRAMLNYKEARWYFQEAVRLKPDYREAQLLLADTLVGLDQPDQALPILRELAAANYEPGHTAYITGLAYYKNKWYSQAVESFRKAQQDPNLTQDAKFQEAMALAAQNRVKEAQRAFRETIGLNPQSTTAGFAQGYATVLDRRAKEYQRFRFSAFGGFDYDSNVSIQPGEDVGFVEISRKNDVFWSLTGSLEYNLLRPGRFALWTYYGYYQNFHHKLTKFDLWSNSAGVVPTYTWEKSRLTVPFNFNYSVVGYKPYSTSFTLTPTFLYLITPKIAAEGGLLWARRDYWFPVYIEADQRSGDALGATVAAYYFLKKQEGYLQARFTYEREFTVGRNWDNSSYRFGLAWQYPLFPTLRVKATADLVLQPYDNYWYNGYPVIVSPKRYDNIFIAGLEITKKLPKNLELSAHCYYIRDDSNIGLYDYDRLIAGLQFGYRY
ncbi:MAG: tetratricopeptide repeat protein [Desulfobaccales bacterium]